MSVTAVNAPVVGQVLEVSVEPTGSITAQDHASGATALVLEDVTDFDPSGGQLAILGVVYDYSAVDYDTNTITLNTGLSSAVSDATPVLVQPASEEKWALVQADPQDDAIRARIPHTLSDKFALGIREEVDRENVEVVIERTAWTVLDIVALAPEVDGQYLRDNSVPAAATGFSAHDIDWDGYIANVESIANQAQASADNATTLANNAQASANGKNTVTFSTTAPTNQNNTAGDTWWVIDEATDTIIGQWQGLGGTSWTQVTLAHQVISSVDLGTATVGKLQGDQLDAGAVRAEHLAAVIAIISKLVSATSGRRWEADQDGIRLYDVDETLLINLPTDPNQPAIFTGDMLASSLTVVDQLAIRGLINEVSRGAQLVLASSTTAPSSPPSPSIEWESLQLTVSDGSDINIYNNITRLGSYYYATYKPTGYTTYLKRFNASTGALDTSFTQSLTSFTVPNGTAVIGNVIYMGGRNSSGGTFRVAGFDTTTNTWVSDWSVAFPANYASGAIGTDGTNIITCTNDINTGAITWVVRNKATGAVISTVNATGYSNSSQLAGLTAGNFDYGAGRVVVNFSGDSNLRVFTTAGAYQSNETFPVATGASPSSVTWDATRAQFVTITSSTAKLHFYTSIKWTTESSTWWFSSTWYDPDSTGGTHETDQGPRKSITMKKRARLRVSLPPLPARPVPNTTDDVVQQKVFIGRGSSDPGRANMEFQIATSATSYLFDSVTLPAGAAAVPPPASNNFPAGTPALLKSQSNTFWVDGTGAGQAGPLNWGSNVNGDVNVTANLGLTNTGVNAFYAGSTSNPNEPSVRLRRQSSNGVDGYEGYTYMWSGTTPAWSTQLRKNGSVVNRIDVTETYGQTTLEWRMPGGMKLGSATAHGTQATMRKNSATQSCATGVWTKISPGASVAAWEDDGGVYTSGNWIATTSGFYIMQASLSWSSSTGSHRAIRISDSANAAYVNAQSYIPTSAPWRTGTVVWCGYLAAGASLSVYFYHDAGTNITVNTDVSTGDPATITFARVA